MSTFTKTYHTEPNKKQKEAMSRVFKGLCQHILNEENKDVTVTVGAFQGDRIIVSAEWDGGKETRIIGVNGGLTIV